MQEELVTLSDLEKLRDDGNMQRHPYHKHNQVPCQPQHSREFSFLMMFLFTCFETSVYEMKNTENLLSRFEVMVYVIPQLTFPVILPLDTLKKYIQIKTYSR